VLQLLTEHEKKLANTEKLHLYLSQMIHLSGGVSMKECTHFCPSRQNATFVFPGPVSLLKEFSPQLETLLQLKEVAFCQSTLTNSFSCKKITVSNEAVLLYFEPTVGRVQVLVLCESVIYGCIHL